LESKRSTDVFTTYLNTLDSKREAEPATSKSVSETRTSGLANMLEVIAKLDASGSEPIRNLVDHSSLEFFNLARTLESMQQEEIVTITGDPGHQVVKLTDNGRSLARLSRSTGT